MSNGKSKQRNKKEAGLSLNLIKAINDRVIPVASYVMNECNLGKSDLDKLDMIVKSVRRILWKKIKR